MADHGEGFATRAVHAGEAPDAQTGAHGTPIYQNTTFALGSWERFNAVYEGDDSIYLYSRDLNPTVRRLEEKVRDLEGADDCVALASGMAAISATLLTIGAGAHGVVSDQVYNTANLLISEDLPTHGMRFSRVDVNDFAAVEAAIEPETRFLYTEVVANPTLKVADIAALAQLAHAHGLLLVVDNTFLSPAIYRPIEHGADIVIHSATKYLAGHGEVLGGVVSGRREVLAPIRTKALRLGGALSAFGAWVILTGIRTLPLRAERHVGNALAVATYLRGQGDVVSVHYPGLPDDPGYPTAARLFGEEHGFGGMVSVRFRGGEPAMAAFVEELRLVTFATSLGDTASLAWPIHGTDLLRLSIGIEDAPDIVADLDRAMVAARHVG